MSEKSSELLKFVLFSPYRRGIQELRNSVNKEHRRVIIKLHEEGFVGEYACVSSSFPESVELKLSIELAGPLYNPADHTLTGSLVVFRAKSFDEAEKVVKADIYYTAGVVDTSPSMKFLLKLSFFIAVGPREAQFARTRTRCS